RTLVATNRRGRWIFLLGFLKNEKANIMLKELEALKELSGDFLSLLEDHIHYAVKKLKLLEVLYEPRP
ncbi:MAG TPA: type II toxin-antitoxin system RelE/ParE family toxin, partial [Gammaproteobacteria bacterium]|nr:type II toxin-antitoxin system RelE/ParE family toxin [Gammaproteobacteria bacterium]